MATLKLKLSSAKIAKAISERVGFALDKELATEVGEAVVTKMLDLVKKGISPIRGLDRYPAYLAVQEGRRGYPDTVQADYPGKSKRPVNLRLSGDFLSNLMFKVKKTGKGITLDIGFFDGLSILKEKGHRDGANGQPSRPMIPREEAGEEFNETIQRVVDRTVNEILKKKLK